MIKIFRKLIFFFIFFILTVQNAFGYEPVKINNLVFDNSDGVIYVNSSGTIDEGVSFTKGYLKDPDRIYVDINNAILTTGKKAYTAKYSSFNSIKISQFTLEPKTVRIVFEYNNNLDLSSFKILKTKNSIFIKTNKTLVKSPKLKSVYSNSPAADRTVFFEGSVFDEIQTTPMTPDDIVLSQNVPQNEITKELSNIADKKQYKINSKYYIDSITKTKNGILINGIGKLNLIPAFTLSEPDRLIIDMDDTVLNPELRNKTFAAGELQTVQEGNGVSLNTRETIRLGQNSQSIARIVIQGESAKDYRGIISPDSKSLYLTNKKNIIETKMSDNNANLVKTSVSKLKNFEVISLGFDDSAAFNAFEENSNLYIDINNVNTFDNSAIEPLTAGIANLQTIRLALDKLRFVIPVNSSQSTSIKTTPDNDEIKIYMKNKEENRVKSEKITLVSKEDTAKKKPSLISNYFTVVIDAGHGGTDVGATRNNIYEKDITLKVSKLVEKNLNKKNVKTYMVRDKDKTVSLAERCEFSNEKKPDVFVSVHVNSSTNDTSFGVETHWYKEDSKKLADCVHRELQKKMKNWKTNDRGLFKSQFYVINHTEAPAILCEIGFISNKNERDGLMSAKRQEETAEAIADGIYNYLKAKK